MWTEERDQKYETAGDSRRQGHKETKCDTDRNKVRLQKEGDRN